MRHVRFSFLVVCDMLKLNVMVILQLTCRVRSPSQVSIKIGLHSPDHDLNFGFLCSDYNELIDGWVGAGRGK